MIIKTNKFELVWNEEYAIHEVITTVKADGQNLITDFLTNDFAEMYHEAPFCLIDNTCNYYVGYRTPDGRLATLKFEIWDDIDPDIGVVTGTDDTENAMLFWTDHLGTFEVFVFEGLKEKTDEMYNLIVASLRGKAEKEAA